MLKRFYDLTAKSLLTLSLCTGPLSAQGYSQGYCPPGDPCFIGDCCYPQPNYPKSINCSMIILGAAAIGAAGGALTGWAVSSNGKRGKQGLTGEQGVPGKDCSSKESGCVKCKKEDGTLTFNITGHVTNNTGVALDFVFYVTDPLCKVRGKVTIPDVSGSGGEAPPSNSLSIAIDDPIDGTYQFGILISSRDGVTPFNAESTFQGGPIDITFIDAIYAVWAPGNEVDGVRTDFYYFPPYAVKPSSVTQIQLSFPFNFSNSLLTD